MTITERVGPRALATSLWVVGFVLGLGWTIATLIIGAKLEIRMISFSKVLGLIYVIVAFVAPLAVARKWLARLSSHAASGLIVETLTLGFLARLLEVVSFFFRGGAG